LEVVEFDGRWDDELMETAVAVVAGSVMVVMKMSTSLSLKLRSIVAHKNMNIN
jgi:hypothetical protein